MHRLSLIPVLLFGCSVRHLEGHDQYSEVCVNGQLELQLELGNKEIDCDSTPADSGQLRMTLAPEVLLEVPIEIQAKDLIRAEWCNLDLECFPVTEGSITLVAYEEGIALSGPYSFVLADGSRIEGELAAQSCDYSPCS